MRRAGVLAWKMLAVAMAGAACSSCVDDYLARRDSLAMSEGDAVRADMARQVIDPSPAAANVTVLDSNGERLQHAMEQYRNPSTNPNGAPGAGGAPPIGTVPVLK